VPHPDDEVCPTATPGDSPTDVPVETARGSGRVVALTFDDGPEPGPTDALLDVLAAAGVRATFCVVGERVRAPGGAALLRRTAAEGHVIANHGSSYADLGDAPSSLVRADLLATLRDIREALGDDAAPVPYYRPANGSWGCTARVAADLGMQPLGLGTVIGDWLTQDAPVLAARLRAAVRPGAVVLAHDGGGDRWGTVAAVREVLPGLVADGWRFVPPAAPGAGAPAPT
jgi:endo-1,4-beta-xylanase